MKPIRVVLAQGSSDVLASVLADAVRRSPDFEVAHPGTASEALLRKGVPGEDDGIDALIVVGDVAADALEAFRLRHPAAVISLIGIGSNRVRVDVRLLGVEELLAALRFHARDTGVARRALRYEIVNTGDDETQEARLASVPSTRSRLLQDAFCWIDAALLRQHSRLAPGASGHGGLTRPDDAIEYLLSRAPRRNGTDDDQAEEAASEALMRSLEDPEAQDEPLARLTKALDLTKTEIKVILLALAPELDAAYQLAFGMLADFAGLRCPTLGLACAIVGDLPHVRSQLSLSRNLTRWRLLETGSAWPRAEDPLRLDAAVVGWIMGDTRALTADPRLSTLVRADPWRGADFLRQRDDVAVTSQLDELVAANGLGEWLVLSGPEPDGWRAQVEQVARLRALRLLRIDGAALAALAPGDLTEAARRMARTARLEAAPIVLDASTAEQNLAACMSGFAGALRNSPVGVLVIAPEPDACTAALADEDLKVVSAEARGARNRAGIFSIAAEDAGISLSADACDALASSHPLALGQIEDAVRLAVMNGAADETAERRQQRVAAACRRVASPDLPRFATRITPAFALDDVILPEAGRAQLREMVNQVQRVPQVMNAWGFGAQAPNGRSVSALFAGPSGTGKTMAAQAVARELGVEAFLVDLSRLVSKFIGESEKHLDAVFGDAERAGAVLVFDEADALFGKRSEIKDAHDRYANMEVAYLLQRMESFSGLVILTTNFRQNLDQAFLRRLRFIIEFPKPDLQAREAIWRLCLPETAPLADDVDLAGLARRLDVTGGNIRQITLRAAFAAAGEGEPAIGMSHLVGAAKAELLKLGRAATADDLVAWQDFLQRAGRKAA